MSTLVVYGSSGDGTLSSECRDGTISHSSLGTHGAGVDTTILRVGYWREDSDDPVYYGWYQFLIAFDTSAVGSGSTVSSAVLSLNCYSVSNWSGPDTFYARSKSWTSGGLTGSDFVAFDASSLLTLLASKAVGSTGWQDFTSQTAMVSEVNKTGSTEMGVYGPNTANDTGGDWCSYFYPSSTAGTTSDPKLTVTYTSSGGSTVAGSFFASADVYSNIAGSFSSNAALKKTQDPSSFSANAGFFKTQTGSFTIQASIPKTISVYTRGPLSGNAWTNPENASENDNVYVTATANVGQSIDGKWDFPSFNIPVGSVLNTVSFVIGAKQSGTTANALRYYYNGTKQVGGGSLSPTTFEVSSSVSVAASNFTVDDFNKPGQIIYEADARRSADPVSTFYIDYLRVDVKYTPNYTFAYSFYINSWIYKKTTTFFKIGDSDGGAVIVFSASNKVGSFNVNAIVRKNDTSDSFTSNAIRKATISTYTYSIASDFYKTGLGSFSASATKAQFAVPGSFTVAAIRKSTSGPYSLTASADLYRKTTTSFLIGDSVNAGGAVIVAPSTKVGSFTASAIKAQYAIPGSATANAIRKASSGILTITSDAIRLASAGTRTFSSSAIVRKNDNAGSFSESAICKANSGTLSFTSDAIRRTSSGTLTFSVSAIVLKISTTGSFSENAIRKTSAGPFTYGASSAFKKTQQSAFYIGNQTSADGARIVRTTYTIPVATSYDDAWVLKSDYTWQFYVYSNDTTLNVGNNVHPYSYASFMRLAIPALVKEQIVSAKLYYKFQRTDATYILNKISRYLDWNEFGDRLDVSRSYYYNDSSYPFNQTAVHTLDNVKVQQSAGDYLNIRFEDNVVNGNGYTIGYQYDSGYVPYLVIETVPSNTVIKSFSINATIRSKITTSFLIGDPVNPGGARIILPITNAPVWVSPTDGATQENPVTFEFTMNPSTLRSTMHFEMQFDTFGTWLPENTRVYQSWYDTTNWEYFNGTFWVAFPKDGVANAYYGRNARFTVNLPAGSWYRRIRGTL